MLLTTIRRLRKRPSGLKCIYSHVNNIGALLLILLMWLYVSHPCNLMQCGSNEIAVSFRASTSVLLFWSPRIITSKSACGQVGTTACMIHLASALLHSSISACLPTQLASSQAVARCSSNHVSSFLAACWDLLRPACLTVLLPACCLVIMNSQTSSLL